MINHVLIVKKNKKAVSVVWECSSQHWLLLLLRLFQNYNCNIDWHAVRASLQPSRPSPSSRLPASPAPLLTNTASLSRCPSLHTPPTPPRVMDPLFNELNTFRRLLMRTHSTRITFGLYRFGRACGGRARARPPQARMEWPCHARVTTVGVIQYLLCVCACEWVMRQRTEASWCAPGCYSDIFKGIHTAWLVFAYLYESASLSWWSIDSLCGAPTCEEWNSSSSRSLRNMVGG